MVDLGRPDRFMHLLWRFNSRSDAHLGRDTLNGYLLLNLHICGYLIYAYCGRKPSPVFYVRSCSSPLSGRSASTR